MNIFLTILLIFILTPILLPVISIWFVVIGVITERSTKIAEDKFKKNKINTDNIDNID